MVEVQLKIEKLSVHAASKKAESGTLCMHWIEGEAFLFKKKSLSYIGSFGRRKASPRPMFPQLSRVFLELEREKEKIFFFVKFKNTLWLKIWQ